MLVSSKWCLSTLRGFCFVEHHTRSLRTIVAARRRFPYSLRKQFYVESSHCSIGKSAFCHHDHLRRTQKSFQNVAYIQKSSGRVENKASIRSSQKILIGSLRFPSLVSGDEKKQLSAETPMRSMLDPRLKFRP